MSAKLEMHPRHCNIAPTKRPLLGSGGSTLRNPSLEQLLRSIVLLIVQFASVKYFLHPFFHHLFIFLMTLLYYHSTKKVKYFTSTAFDIFLLLSKTVMQNTTNAISKQSQLHAFQISNLNGIFEIQDPRFESSLLMRTLPLIKLAFKLIFR